MDNYVCVNFVSVYTTKRHIESTLLSSRKTVKSCQEKKKNRICFLIIVCIELETGDEIIALKEDSKVFFLLIL